MCPPERRCRPAGGWAAQGERRQKGASGTSSTSAQGSRQHVARALAQTPSPVFLKHRYGDAIARHDDAYATVLRWVINLSINSTAAR
jgi:hypothetical protein